MMKEDSAQGKSMEVSANATPSTATRGFTALHKCPDWGNGTNLIGCGHEFEAEPDDEGWLDCPECGLAFKATETP